ncbi:TetR/AcrR family transcriptional regulator [Nonomuraea sp. NPDC050227]|uniref:TetR/AcrR family transcriptional regulator n=1 Tax=Nonomuraea sp. NPDC050227 TaxID=3364360 RepID=UPI0037B8F99C
MTDPEDLTARARIREAALLHFGEHGFEGATTRAIAGTAGVSPGLLRHHYGSKQALREACDEHLIRLVRRIDDDVRAGAVPAGRNPVAAALDALAPYRLYVARALAEGWAAPLFDGIAELSERWLAELDETRTDEPFAGRRARATVSTAMSLSVGVLHKHVSRGLGVDVFSPEGAYLLALTLLDLYSHPLLTPEAAAELRDALGKPPGSG